ncbi:MAG: MBL fold metallo-hydrolase [Candidatus Lokiarchaeota archaeon]|nr:MBL fold metallo-hydrolase [Candidatus Lokiarchaeota archaeon]
MKLENLKTDGELVLYFIGVGSALATKHNQTNLLIMKGDDHVMVDFGRTGPEAFHQTTGLSPYDIEVILPTHSHGDHIGGFEQLAQMNKYVGIPFMGKPKLKMVVSVEYQRILWENSLRGGLEYNEQLAHGRVMAFTDYFDIIRPQWVEHKPREIFSVDVGSISLELFRTNHIPEQSDSWSGSFISYGLSIDGRVFYSGDTKFDEELLDTYADHSEVLFHDVQFFPGAVHAPLYSLNTLPSKWKEKMYLVHYADNYDEQDITGFAGWTEQGHLYTFKD